MARAAKRKNKRRKQGIGVRIASLFLLVLIVLFAYFFGPEIRSFFGEETTTSGIYVPPVPDGSYIEMHVIDVGQGDSILIRTSGGDMLIDSGPGSAEDELHDYLTELEIKDIEYAVFTHPDADHIGNADMIMTDFSVSNVILPNKESSSKTYQRMMDAIDASGATVIEPIPEESFTLGEMTVTILAPISEKYSDTNNYSVVMRLDFGETSFLMTGDAEAGSEKEMLEKYGANLLDCDVLKVGHHGSDTSSSEAFLRAVSPQIALISCGTGNTFGHPCAVTLQKLEAMNATLYRTDWQGSIVLVSDGSAVTVKNTTKSN